MRICFEVKDIATKRDDIDAQYVIDEYRAGRSTKDIAGEFGCTSVVIYRILHEGGAEMRPSGTARAVVPLGEMIAAYESGVSENALAEKYGCDRLAIKRRLVKAGVLRRGLSDALVTRWERMTPAQRAIQTEKANRAARGRVMPLEAKVLRAHTVQQRRLHISRVERVLAEWLRDRGVETIAQQAIGPYNCDIGAAPVAVEVFGGYWHWYGRHLFRTPERFRYLLDAGWHVLVVAALSKAYPVTEATADYVANYVREARRNPAAPREYRVIRCAGETLTAGRADDDEIAIKAAFTDRSKWSAGRNERIAR